MMNYKNPFCLNCDTDKFSINGNCSRQIASDGMISRCTGPWAEIKHNVLKEYCSIFTRGMGKKYDELNYIDLFSGPGIYFNRESGIESPGSALIALEYEFTNIYLNDLNSDNMEALNKRIGATGKQANIYNKDANIVGSKINGCLSNNSISFCLLDPDNIGNLKFDTIADISRNKKHFDILINFAYLDYRRSVHVAEERFDEFFGSTKWREIEPKYSGKSPLFRANALVNIYMEQLKTLGFIKPTNPKLINFFPIYNTNNGLLYYLIFISKHIRGYEFCSKMAKYAISQQRLEF
jgi:three-Cys-motif partner protein